MNRKIARINAWYTKDPKKFRMDALNWLSESSRGGELGRIFIDSFVRYSRFYNPIVQKALNSKTFRGTFIFLVIASIGVFIKGKPNVPIYETIFDNLDSISLGSAGLIFLVEIKDRQKRDHYEAWQVINSSQGQTGSGGRIQALQDLNADGINLEGVAAPGADLSGVNLQGAKLNRARLGEAILSEANLQEAELENADLRGAYLWKANLHKTNLKTANLQRVCLNEADLQEAILIGAIFKADINDDAFDLESPIDIKGASRAHLCKANLQRATLEYAQMQGAYLLDANLESADLYKADFRRAYLTRAILKGVDLRHARLNRAVLADACLENADLQEAYLLKANLHKAVLKGTNLAMTRMEGATLLDANLAEAKNVSQEQLEQAYLCRTMLPDNIKLNPNRDCKTQFGIDPEMNQD